jgi:hypothetical protein
MLIAVLVIAAGCITADGTIEPGGAARLTLSFPTVATPQEDKAARALVTAPDVTIESLTISDAAAGERGPRRATAKLAAKSVAPLAQVPLLRALGATVVHDAKPAGGGTVKVELRNATPGKKDDPQVVEMMKYEASLRLHVPGPVLETSATAKDGAVEWRFPSGDWTAGKSLALTVAYGAPTDGGEKPGEPSPGS